MATDTSDMGVLPSTSSFTPLGTIPLPHAHVLHPYACCPTMDLVVLFDEADENAAIASGIGASGTAGSSTDKGKGKAAANVSNTCVTLWHTTGGHKVWDLDVSGRVLGLAWTSDGLFLSILVLRFSTWPASGSKPDVAAASKSTVETVSVHTGEVAKAIPVPKFLLEALDEDDWAAVEERGVKGTWWPLSWVDGSSEWAEKNPGSALMIVDSLPRVTPVEPPQPTIINLNPYAQQAAKKNKEGMHSKMIAFPTLLPANPSRPPEILVVEPPVREGPVRRANLLTGTFLLAAGTRTTAPESMLALAQCSDVVAKLLDIVFRGLESCQAAFKEGEKQTMIWREELEECGEQQGLSVEDVHADLFRFLMTGRSGSAVNEWLGNRMTNRTIAKWEAALETSFSTISKVITQSISPAVERITLILDELQGEASELSGSDIVLDTAQLGRAVDVASGLAHLVESMRQSAELELEASTEWSKWMRYEMVRAIAGADDPPPQVQHDLKLVWSFMKNGFVKSAFRQHFPNVPGSTDDLLMSSIPAKPPKVATPELDGILRATLSRLLAPNRSLDFVVSPATQPDASYSSSQVSPLGAAQGSPSVIASSPDTVGDPSMRGFAPEPVERFPEREPWSWANSLLAHVEDVIRHARPSDPPPERVADWLACSLPRDMPYAERTVEGSRWVVSQSSRYLDVVNFDPDSGTLAGARFNAPEGAVLLQAEFFDDFDLAIVFALEGQQYIGTAELGALAPAMEVMDREHLAGMVSACLPSPLTTQLRTFQAAALPLARCRHLGRASSTGQSSWILALNGREGRRLGCVLTRGGTEVEVLDMEEDEDDEDDDDEDEGDVDMEV